MDFTVGQFLDMFHRYNDAIWPLQFVAYAFGLVVCALIARRSARGERFALLTLSAMWAWMGVVFMWGFQADISSSGRPFGALFLVGAALLGLAAVRTGSSTSLGLGGAPRWRLAAGWAMIAYALVVYPLVGMALGHSYPEAPLFGVAPCPTTIFTLGVFVTCACPRLSAVVVPIVWGFIGTMAAIKLEIGQDFGMTVAAVVAIVCLVAARREDQKAQAPDESPATRLRAPATGR